MLPTHRKIATVWLLLLCLAALVCGVLADQQNKAKQKGVKPEASTKRFQFFRLSTTGTLQGLPNFVSTSTGLYIGWLVTDHDAKRGLYLAAYDASARTFGKAWRAIAEKPNDQAKLLDSTLVLYALTEMPAPVGEGVKGKASFAGVFLNQNNFSSYPEITFHRLIPDAQKEQYRLTSESTVVDKALYHVTVPDGGLLCPQYFSLVRQQDKKDTRLFLIGSDYSQLWGSASVNGGRTWPKHKAISRQDDNNAQLLVHPQRGVMLFSTDSQEMLRMSASKDGNTWAASERLNVPGKKVRRYSVCADDKGVLWLAYTTKAGGYSPLYLTQSADGGQKWQQPLLIADGQYGDLNPSIAVWKERLFLAVTRVTKEKMLGQNLVIAESQVWVAVQYLDALQFPAS